MTMAPPMPVSIPDSIALLCMTEVTAGQGQGCRGSTFSQPLRLLRIRRYGGLLLKVARTFLHHASEDHCLASTVYVLSSGLQETNYYCPLPFRSLRMSSPLGPQACSCCVVLAPAPPSEFDGHGSCLRPCMSIAIINDPRIAVSLPIT